MPIRSPELAEMAANAIGYTFGAAFDAAINQNTVSPQEFATGLLWSVAPLPPGFGDLFQALLNPSTAQEALLIWRNYQLRKLRLEEAYHSDDPPTPARTDVAHDGRLYEVWFTDLYDVGGPNPGSTFYVFYTTNPGNIHSGGSSEMFPLYDNGVLVGSAKEWLANVHLADGVVPVGAQFVADGNAMISDPAGALTPFYSQGASYPWSSYSDFYANGTFTNQQTTYQDDQTASYYHDAAHASWEWYVDHFTDEGVFKYEWAQYDNGSWAYYQEDWTDSHPWASFTDYYDPAERFDAQFVEWDDGTSSFYDFDQRGEFNWVWIREEYDVHGRVMFGRIRLDSGSFIYYDRDEQQAHEWETLAYLIAPNGTVTKTEITGGNGPNNIQGTGRNDALFGLGGNDILHGQAGDDTFYGGTGSGADTFYGGDGNDTASYAAASAAMVINLNIGTATGEGTDRLFGIERAAGGAGNDTMTGDAGANVFAGNGGDDTFEGGAGNDTLYGCAGFDSASYTAASGAIVANLNNGMVSGDGTDRLFDVERILGGGRNDTMTGNAGANVFVGNGGDDSFFGGAGADTYYGGQGNDFFRIDDIGDLAFETGTGADRAQVFASGAVVGEGIERIDLGGVVGLTVTAAGNTHNTMDGTAANDRLIAGAGNDRVIGRAGHDTLEGEDGNDTIDAGDGDDTLYGGAGADRMFGGAGTNTFFGGAGDDDYRIGSVTDVSDETDGAGFDRALVSVSGAAVGQGIELIELTAAGGAMVSALGSTDNTMVGAAGDDVMYGGDGADTFWGGGGADTYFGGAGDDVYRFNDAGDRADESGGSGADRADIFASVATVGEGIERIDVRATTDTSVVAEGATDNTIVGRTGSDTLLAGAGNDRVFGGVGDDVLDGELGNDFLDGGADNDTLQGGDGVDRLFGGDGIDRLIGGAGIDSLTGGAGADVFVYAAGDGNDRFLDFSSAQGDKVDLDGVTFVSAVNNVATLSDGAVLTAQTGYVWTGADFI